MTKIGRKTKNINTETQVKQYDLIAIPDVHGRMFWKDALPCIENGTPVVFLGDYLDPYPHEGIEPGQALENFKEILSVIEGKDNVTMLIGNHDFEYMVESAPECRCDYLRYDKIHDLFWENADRFYFGKQFRPDMATPPLTFSHAGVHYAWYQELRAELATVLELKDDDRPILGALEFNDALEYLKALDDWHKQNEQDIRELLFSSTVKEILTSPVKDIYIRFLNRVSRLRGGVNMYGSMIWADIREFNIQEPFEPFGLQVVGHTMQVHKEYTDKGHRHYKWVPGEPFGLASSIICIDCQHCYGIVHDPETSFYNLEEIKSH